MEQLKLQERKLETDNAYKYPTIVLNLLNIHFKSIVLYNYVTVV